MDKINKTYIPLAIFTFISINTVLKNLSINYLYAMVTLLGIVFLLLTGNVKYKSKNSYIVLSFILSIVAVHFIQLIVYAEPKLSMRAMLSYLLFLVYWFMYFSCYKVFDFKAFLIRTFPIIYVIAILGVIQFFISPDLFSFLPKSSNAIKWASNTTFSQYVLYFRASSTLGSPQVYGLFMILSFVMISNLQKGFLNFKSRMGLALILFSGSLSGNKLFLLLLVVYILLNLLRNKKQVLYVVSLLFTVGIFMISNMEKFEALTPIIRMIDISSAMQTEEEGVRINRYWDSINNTNLLIGKGLGSKSFVEKSKLKASESYILQLFYEAGIIVTILFIVMLVGAYFSAKNVFLPGIQDVILLMFISMFFVHAFGSPVFFLFWGGLVSSFFTIENKRSNELCLGTLNRGRL